MRLGLYEVHFKDEYHSIFYLGTDLAEIYNHYRNISHVTLLAIDDPYYDSQLHTSPGIKIVKETYDGKGLEFLG